MVPEIIVVQAIPPAHAPRPSRFHEFLSELNPLQYLPIVGTLYRAITGDTIPERARIVGSMVVSGLMGGPVGVALNVATLAVEKATGLDPEKLGTTLLSDLGLASKPHPRATAQAPQPPPAPAPAAAWSPAQLAAYGVTTTPDGTLHQGALSGSDVLNALELARTA